MGGAPTTMADLWIARNRPRGKASPVRRTRVAAQKQNQPLPGLSTDSAVEADGGAPGTGAIASDEKTAGKPVCVSKAYKIQIQRPPRRLPTGLATADSPMEAEKSDPLPPVIISTDTAGQERRAKPKLKRKAADCLSSNHAPPTDAQVETTTGTCAKPAFRHKITARQPPPPSQSPLGGVRLNGALIMNT